MPDTQNLYILPFDHRGSFKRAFFDTHKNLDDKKIKILKSYKKIIYQAFLLSQKYIERYENCGILVDEELGSDIIRHALKKNIITAVPTEKSSQRVFAFEHGKNFDKYIAQIEPDIVKALLRVHPDNHQANQLQLKRLRRLYDWCHVQDFNLLVEMLVPPSDKDLQKVGHNREEYDKKIRPTLTLQSIQLFYKFNIFPNIWKIEAFEETAHWKPVIDLIRDEDRENTGIIMLGRGESFAKVKSWMNIAPRHLLNGFAVGRTVFLRPLLDYHHKYINKKQAIEQIAKNFIELVRYWEKG